MTAGRPRVNTDERITRANIYAHDLNQINTYLKGASVAETFRNVLKELVALRKEQAEMLAKYCRAHERNLSATIRIWEREEKLIAEGKSDTRPVYARNHLRSSLNDMIAFFESEDARKNYDKDDRMEGLAEYRKQLKEKPELEESP